jgi:hypothetical protein
MRRLKTAHQEGRLFVLICAFVAHVLFHHPTKRPTFSNNVGFGRRVRGNTNFIYILGAILLPTGKPSMILDGFALKSTRLGHTSMRLLCFCGGGSIIPLSLQISIFEETSMPKQPEFTKYLPLEDWFRKQPATKQHLTLTLEQVGRF